jgi:hypothetical protein
MGKFYTCKRCHRADAELFSSYCSLCKSIVNEKEEREEERDQDRKSAEERSAEAIERATAALEEREEREDRRAELKADAIREAAYKRNNPGEYKCASCLYKTLNAFATKCPCCQANTPAGFWDWLLAHNAEMDRLKIQAARISASVPECQLMDIPDEPTDHSDSIAVYSALLFLWLLPFLIAKVFLLNHAQQGDSPPPAFILLIPALNWIGLLFSFPWLSGGFGVAVKTIGGAIGVSVGTAWFARWQFNSLKKEREEVIKKNDQRKLDRKTEIAKLILKEDAERNAQQTAEKSEAKAENRLTEPILRFRRPK